MSQFNIIKPLFEKADLDAQDIGKQDEWLNSLWDKHDTEKRDDLLNSLRENVDIANERNHEESAKRFYPSKGLTNAINAALAARVPLLLTGEPGTGKTQVAWFIKRYLGIKLFEYQVRSTSQAVDLRYDFDAVAYLRDAYIAKAVEAEVKMQDGSDPRSDPKYLKPGPLWNAYNHNDESVLLIDEIDKAPRDFPNDLLQELDQHRFAHPFDPQTIITRSGPPPIIIITSNGERRLPDAFLRRCMVHHIELDKGLLSAIMGAWGNQFPYLDDAFKEKAIKRFYELRDESRLEKKPAAAELLLWLGVLSAKRTTIDEISDETPLADLPELECLIKHNADKNKL